MGCNAMRCNAKKSRPLILDLLIPSHPESTLSCFNAMQCCNAMKCYAKYCDGMQLRPLRLDLLTPSQPESTLSCFRQRSAVQCNATPPTQSGSADASSRIFKAMLCNATDAMQLCPVNLDQRMCPQAEITLFCFTAMRCLAMQRDAMQCNAMQSNAARCNATPPNI